MINSYGSFYGCQYSEVDVISQLKDEGREHVAFYDLVFIDMLYHVFYDKCRDIIRYATETKGQTFSRLSLVTGFELVYQINGNISVSHTGKLRCSSGDVDILCIKLNLGSSDPLYIVIDQDDDRYTVKVLEDLPKYPCVSLIDFQDIDYDSFKDSEFVSVPIYGDSSHVPTTKVNADREQAKKDSYLASILNYLANALKGQLGKNPQHLATFCMKVIEKRYSNLAVAKLKDLSSSFPDDELFKVINEDWILYAKNQL